MKSQDARHILRLISIVALGLIMGGSRSVGETKVLHFPADQCMGRLSAADLCLGSENLETGRDLSFPFGFDPKRVCLAGDEDFVGQAQGDVMAPANRNLHLVVVLRPSEADKSRMSPLSRHFQASRTTIDPCDLSGLARLDPNDLFHLRISAPVRTRDADRRILKPISRLTGLRVLGLYQTGVTDHQMDSLTPLQSLLALELHAESSLRNAGLAALKDLPSLEYLDLDAATTDVGLKHLAEIPNLRYLRLRMGRIWGRGLAELAAAPRLERLCLWGEKGLTDRHVSYLEGLPHLKSLTLWGTSEPLTDATLASIGKLTSLEELYFIRINTKFTDAGMAHLKSLRRLRRAEGLGSYTIGAEGLRHLATLPELECLDGVELSAEAIAVLPSFAKLKTLHFAGVMPPKGKPVPRQDISGLARLTQVEDLFVAGDRWNPEDLDCLASMPHLKRLSIMDDATDENLAVIGRLKELEHLTIWSNASDISKEGLNQLRGLTNLQSLSVRLFQDVTPPIEEMPLDLSPLRHLKTLSLSGLSLDDEDLASFAGMSEVEWFSLQNGSFTDAGLRHLQGLSAVKILMFGEVDCSTGEGLTALSGLESLGNMTLLGRIPDRAVDYLTGLPSLWSLRLVTDEPIRAETADRLKERLPALQHLHIEEPFRPNAAPAPVRRSRPRTQRQQPARRRR